MTEYVLPMRECKLGPLALILSDLSCRLAVAVARGNGVSFDMQKECDSWCETWLSLCYAKEWVGSTHAQKQSKMHHLFGSSVGA
jgi:hypothetical protein